MKPANFAVLVLSIYTTGITSAAEQRIVCPKRLEPDAIQSYHPPTGWELHMLRPVYLTEGGMLHGPPSESAFLVPDGSTSRKVGNRTFETLHWSFDIPHGYATWAYCGYGGGGATLKLFKQVPESATGCTLSSESTGGQIKDSVVFACK
jgi:hypothetical protein